MGFLHNLVNQFDTNRKRYINGLSWIFLLHGKNILIFFNFSFSIEFTGKCGLVEPWQSGQEYVDIYQNCHHSLNSIKETFFYIFLLKTSND